MWSSLTWPYLTHGLTSLRGILSISARFLLENSIKAKGLWPCLVDAHLVTPCVWLPEATIYFHKSLRLVSLAGIVVHCRENGGGNGTFISWAWLGSTRISRQVLSVQMELEAGTQDDEALQVQHTSSCPLTCRAGGLVYAGQKPQWLDLDGVSWWMLVGRWSRGFNDCDQGCRFVILAALGAQSPLYARQRRQAFLSYRSLFHLTYVGVNSVFATIFVIF